MIYHKADLIIYISRSLVNSQAIMSDFETDNRFPDCVFLKLHSSKLNLQSNENLIKLPHSYSMTKVRQFPLINLQITLRFGRAVIKVPGGWVRFGLRRGELNLELINGKMPLEMMNLVAPFETSIQQEEHQENGYGINGILSIKGGITGLKSSKKIGKMKYTNCPFENRGTEEEPIWAFEAKVGSPPILKGQLTEEPLGVVQTNGDSSSIRMQFKVLSQRHLWLEGEGLWSKDLSRNKLALLEREFFLRFIAPRLQPYISKVEGDI